MRRPQEPVYGLSRPEPRACFCRGPQPGHTLCPCMERQQDAEEKVRGLELAHLRIENARLRRELRQLRQG